jgi:hypothetical protein
MAAITWCRLWQVMRICNARSSAAGINQSYKGPHFLTRLGFLRCLSYTSTENVPDIKDTQFQHILDQSDSLQKNVAARQMKNDVGSLVVNMLLIFVSLLSAGLHVLL